MTPLNLSQIEAEFDKTYDKGDSPAFVKQFYRQKITELLESTKLKQRMVHGQEAVPEWLAEKEGYNLAVSDQADKINQALK